MNTKKYCLVDTTGVDQVKLGPQLLPNSYMDDAGNQHYNLRNEALWSDPALLAIGWYRYFLIDAGAPGEQYNRTLSAFDIQPDRVNQTAIYTEWTQEQKDQNAETEVKDSQREAISLADQTEALLRQNAKRVEVGAAPIIDAADVPDVEVYLKETYDAVDDFNNAPKEPPGATRQVTVVTGEQHDRAVIRRIRQTWNVPDDIYALSYTLYTGVDATGMSVKIHDGVSGIYLYTMALAETEPGSGVWFAETHSSAWGQHLEQKAWNYVLFKGVDISQMRHLLVGEEEQVFNVRWMLNGLI